MKKKHSKLTDINTIIPEKQYFILSYEIQSPNAFLPTVNVSPIISASSPITKLFDI